MFNETLSAGSAEKMASKPIRWSVAIVSIGLIFSLALTTIIGNFSDLQSIYSEIINQQEEQAALAFVSQKPTKNSAKEIETLPPQETNRVIIKYKEKDLPPGLAIAAERANLEKAQGLKHILTISGINAQVYEVSEDDTASEVVNRTLSTKKDLIEYAEVDMLAVPAYIPNDPYYTNASSWHLGKISAATAWDTSKGDGVTVAILDSGVDCTHTELSTHCVPGWNAASNNTDSTDINGHGTLVASTLGSIGDNAQGGVGVTFNSKIMPIRLTNDPANQGVSCSYIASGITYAADHGAKVASNSYEIFGCAVVTDAANYMASKGGIYVRAAGNSGAQINTTNDENVIIASATDGNDVKTTWSNYGSIVDVSAPGINVYCSSKTGSYGTCWGTSFSVPITSGVLALIFSTNPALTPTQAKSILFSSTDDIGTAGWDMYYGHGRVNSAKAVAAALATVSTQDTKAPTIPANLAASNVTSNSASLYWNPATDDNSGVAGYSIYRNGTKLTTVAGTAYTNSGLIPNTAYTYTVRAEDVAGNSSGDSNQLAVTTPDISFGISSYSIPQKTSNGATVAVSLTKTGTVTIKYGISNTNLNLSAQSATTSTSHSLSLSGLTASTTYYYQVVATDGATTIASPVSSFKTNKATGGGKTRR